MTDAALSSVSGRHGPVVMAATVVEGGRRVVAALVVDDDMLACRCSCKKLKIAKKMSGYGEKTLIYCEVEGMKYVETLHDDSRYCGEIYKHR